MRQQGIKATVIKLERLIGQRDMRSPEQITAERIQEAIDSGDGDCHLVKRWQSGDRSRELVQWIVDLGSNTAGAYPEDELV